MLSHGEPHSFTADGVEFIKLATSGELGGGVATLFLKSLALAKSLVLAGELIRLATPNLEFASSESFVPVTTELCILLTPAVGGAQTRTVAGDGNKSDASGRGPRLDLITSALIVTDVGSSECCARVGEDDLCRAVTGAD